MQWDVQDAVVRAGRSLMAMRFAVIAVKRKRSAIAALRDRFGVSQR